MSDYLNLVLSKVKEPHESVRPRLPSIFEPLPLDLRLPGEIVGAEAERVGRDGTGSERGEEIDDYHAGPGGNERIDEYNDGPQGSEAIRNHNARSERIKVTGMHERGGVGVVNKEDYITPPNAGPLQPRDNNRLSRHSLHMEGPESLKKSRDFQERPDGEETAKTMREDLSKPIRRSRLGKHITANLLNPNPGGPETEEQGSLGRQGREDRRADKIDDHPGNRRLSARFQPADDSLLKLGPRLKVTAPQKAKDLERREDSRDFRPTIKVTIGRIEVRASNRPIQTRRDIPERPKQSLEDYLRQRRGGNR